MHFKLLFSTLVGYCVASINVGHNDKNPNEISNEDKSNISSKSEFYPLKFGTFDPIVQDPLLDHMEVFKNQPVEDSDIHTSIWDRIGKMTLQNCILLYEILGSEATDDANTDLTKIQNYLNGMLTTETTGHNGTQKMLSSLNHPICYDVFKLSGPYLNIEQINWIIKNAPYIILENGECFKALRDFSFIDLEFYKKVLSVNLAIKHIDILQLPYFWMTANLPVLMHVLVRDYNPSIHEIYLLDNLKKIVSLPDLFKNPLYYPFLSQMSDLKQLSKYPSNYEIDSSHIAEYITSNGLDCDIISSLLCYIFLTNAYISQFINEIANIWISLDNGKQINSPHFINQVFRNNSKAFFSKLSKIFDARERVNGVISELSRDDIKLSGNKHVIIESLKLISQVSFERTIQKSFGHRKKGQNYVSTSDSSSLISDGFSLPTPSSLNDSADETTFNHVLKCALWWNLTAGSSSTIYSDKYAFIPIETIIMRWVDLFNVTEKSFKLTRLTFDFVKEISFDDKHDLIDLKYLTNLWSENSSILNLIKQISWTSKCTTCGFKKLLSVNEVLRELDGFYNRYMELYWKCKLEESLLYKLGNYNSHSETTGQSYEFSYNLFMNYTDLFAMTRKMETLFMLLGDDFTEEQLAQLKFSGIIMTVLSTNPSKLLSKTQLTNLMKTEAGVEFLSNFPNVTETSEIIRSDEEFDKLVFSSYTKPFTMYMKSYENETTIAVDYKDSLPSDAAACEETAIIHFPENLPIESFKSVLSDEKEKYDETSLPQNSIEDIAIPENNNLYTAAITENDHSDEIGKLIIDTVTESILIKLVADELKSCEDHFNETVSVALETIETEIIDGLVLTSINIHAEEAENAKSKANLSNIKYVSPLVSVNSPAKLKERLDKIKLIDINLFKRFNQSSLISGPVGERLSADHEIVYLSGYCMLTFCYCAYLNDSQNISADLRGGGVNYLDDIIAMQFSEGVLRSLGHPMCVDAFKRVGKIIRADHINWFIKHAPFVIFDNVELLSTLSDFSFYTKEVHNIASDYYASQMVDLLKLEPFWRTAPVEFLLAYLRTYYNEAIHGDLMKRYRPIETILYDKSVLLNPQHYSLFSAIVDCQKYGLSYIINSGSRIVQAIREEGMTPILLESLIVFALKTNTLISAQINIITDIFIKTVMSCSESSDKLKSIDHNFGFNVLTKRAMAVLFSINIQREFFLNQFLPILESNGRGISTDLAILSECKNIIDHLKVLLQTPFDLNIRRSLKQKVEFASEIRLERPEIEDTNMIIPLTRMLKIDDDKIRTSLYFRTVVWRNVFFGQTLSWKAFQAEIMKSIPIQSDSTLNSTFETMYRNNRKTSLHLLDSWAYLTGDFSSRPFSRGHHFISFLLEISPRPEIDERGVKYFPRDVEIERNMLMERMVRAVKDIDSAYLIAKQISLFEELWSDSESILEELKIKSEEMEKRVLVSSAAVKSTIIFQQVISISDLTSLCKAVIKEYSAMTQEMNNNMKQNVTNIYEIEKKFYKNLRAFETSFASLGEELTDVQIGEISKNKFIVGMLKVHCRAITRTQVVGLIKSEIGRQFLKDHREILTALIDYSAFTPELLTELELKVSDIKLNAQSLPKEIHMHMFNSTSSLELLQEDPLAATYNLGLFYFWLDNEGKFMFFQNNLLNPLTVALNRISAISKDMFDTLSVSEGKLRKLPVGREQVDFVVRWLIEQEWNCLIYTAGLEIISNISDNERKKYLEESNLSQVYDKFVSEELKGRKEISKWIKGLKEEEPVNEERDGELREEVKITKDFDVVDVDVLEILNQTYFTPETTATAAALPVTLFRREAELKRQKSETSTTTSISKEQLLYLKKLVMKYCSKSLAPQLIAKLEALSLSLTQLPTVKTLELRNILMNLSPWDAAILYTLLKKHVEKQKIERILSGVKTAKTSSK